MPQRATKGTRGGGVYEYAFLACGILYLFILICVPVAVLAHAWLKPFVRFPANPSSACLLCHSSPALARCACWKSICRDLCLQRHRGVQSFLTVFDGGAELERFMS